MNRTATEVLDPTTLVVMSNRLDSISRAMTNTVVRAARSTTMAAKDFSCSLLTAQHELISAPEGLPCHCFGTGPSAATMAELHPEFREGDAFLHNDPYRGNSHAADHQILVPIFVEGEHVFTACVKAHQVDCGDALPTTYMPMAKDVYEEGAIIFPCVKVQTDYTDVDDIIRMCEMRIRAFDTWHGDFLAQLGACRLAERQVKEFCAKFGVETVKRFVTDWLDYSERITSHVIADLPAGRVVGETQLDPFPGAPDGIPLKTVIDVDPGGGSITVDLRENPDCYPNGLNLTETASMTSGIAGVLAVLNSRADAGKAIVPNNAGTHRRIEVLLRENCVVGIPRHPASCSLATNTVADRVIAMVFTAFAKLEDGLGLAEPCFGAPPHMAVVSGRDRRIDDFYIMQILSGSAGGPASPEVDGWLTLLTASGAGLVYIDSAEVVEQKVPLVIWDKTVRMDSEGAGRRRGAPGNVCIYSSRLDPLTSHYHMEGVQNRPGGVNGGGLACGPEAWTIDVAGNWEEKAEMVGAAKTAAGESVVSLSAGGGGYGDPLDREPELVLADVVERFVSFERAREVYGVVLNGDPDRFETLAVDEAETQLRRGQLRGNPDLADVRCEPYKPSWWAGADLAGIYR